MAIENLPSHLDPNDPQVKQAHRGKGWGKEDQARYDKLVSAKQKAQTHQQKEPPKAEKKPAATPQKPPTQTIGATGKPTNPVDNTVTADNDAVKTNHQITQEQNITQDNDINTNVTGNNNTVITEQDNSIRQYGGDNRSFVYNAGAGPSYMDTPVSAATMSGFYDVDDSPAAQASFMDRWTTMNRDNQKRYAGDAMKTYNMFGKIDARSYTPESMSTAIGRHTQYSFDRADRQTGHVFGDIWNPNYITEKWQMPSPPKEIESNAAEIAKDAKDDIEDI